MKNLLIAILAFTFSLTSCKKDENTKPQNYFTVEGKTIEFKKPGEFFYDEDRIIFYLYPDNEQEEESFRLSLAADKIGKKHWLEEYDDSGDLALHVDFEFSENEYGHFFKKTSNSRTNEWIKVVKNRTVNNYTIEFEFNINNKLVKGVYTGPFEHITNPYN